MENASTSVVVKLEIGHQASVRSEKTPEGFTHDWTVFVRGPEGINIHHFVDKVIFYLHESFHKPKRVVKEPPYQVSESGYAGFILPIEVYFKNKEEPKKVRFEYDLYLRMDGPPVNNFRCEKLTFQNPVDDFRRKLVKAGGIGPLVSSDNTGNVATVQTHSTTLGQDKGDHSSDSQKLAVTKVSSFRNQEKKKHSSSKEATKNLSSTSRVSKPFNAIFGEPIKTKQSPDQAVKQKEVNAVSQSSQKAAIAHTKPNKVPTSSHPSSNLSHSTKENKVSRAGKEKSPHEKESKDSKHTKSSKYPEKESKQPSLKRQSSPHSQHGSDKKRKRTTSSSSESNPSSQSERKEASKSKHKEPKVKEKHKSKTNVDNDNTISNSRKERSKDKYKVSKHAKKLLAENSVISPLHHGSQRTSDAHIDGNNAHSMQTDDKIDTSMMENKEDSVTHVDDLNSSPSSSISLSSLQPGGSDGPLATMMAEMEKDLLSPLSSDPGSHSLSNSPVLKEKSEDNHTSDGDINISQSTIMECTSRVTEEPVEKIDELDKGKKDSTEQGSKPRKDQIMTIKKKRDEIDGRVLEETASKSSAKRGKPGDSKNTDEMDKKRFSQVDQADVNELIDLQQKIMSLRDRHILQKIVDVIEETGNYDVTNSSFDFDLCRLDQMTVRKLQNCLAVK